MKKVTIVMMAASAVALAACAKPDLPGSSLGATFTAERFLNEEHGGSGFNGALASEYSELGRRAAFRDVRWYNSTAYIAKTEAAEAGADVGPWSPESLGVEGEAAGLYDETVGIIRENRGERPAACARMQAMWDQWLESLRAVPSNCPLPPEEAFALYEEARAACQGVPLEDNFIVYFGFDRSDLTSRALAVIEDVVGAVDEMGATALSIVGHTDTSGSASYNQALSERRARSVAGAMVDRGVPRGAMTLAGRGEREPARVTGDGVREPLNRRVEITISE